MYVFHEKFQSDGNLHLKIFKSLSSFSFNISSNRISWKLIFAFDVEISLLQMLPYMFFVFVCFVGFFLGGGSQQMNYFVSLHSFIINIFHIVVNTNIKTNISRPVKFL